MRFNTPQVRTVKLRLPVQPAASVAVMVNVALLAVVGAPVNAPVVAFNKMPAGSAPLVTLYVTAPVAPVVEIVAL